MGHTDIDKRIAQALGLCWHEWKRFTPEVDGWNCDKVHGWDKVYYECLNCHATMTMDKENNPDFSTWEGMGIIFERGPGREWWSDFKQRIGMVDPLFGLRKGVADEFLNPPRIRKELWELLNKWDNTIDINCVCP